MHWSLRTLYKETPKLVIFYYYYENDLRETRRKKDIVWIPKHYIKISKEDSTTLNNLNDINPELAQEFFKQKVEECEQNK